MILFHFTAEAFLERIKAQGLKKGIVPWEIDKKTGDVICRRNLQWLTANDNWSQEWMKRGAVPFSKNAARLMIYIPPNAQDFVLNWDDLCKRQNVESAADLNKGCDHHNWRLFMGRIPPSWVIGVDRNPGPTLRPDIPEIGRN